MNATHELREGLRKRGEGWYKWPDDDSTTWQAYSNPHTAIESMDGTLIVTGLTPEQAIAATLGSGTCHLKPWEMERDTGFYDCMECDCGHVADVADWAEWSYCPNCGARVTDVDG